MAKKSGEDKVVKTGLEARVREDYLLGPVMAFSGHEYIQNEWRLVPVGFESQAIVHPLLETRDAVTQESTDASTKAKLPVTSSNENLFAGEQSEAERLANETTSEVAPEEATTETKKKKK